MSWYDNAFVYLTGVCGIILISNYITTGNYDNTSMAAFGTHLVKCQRYSLIKMMTPKSQTWMDGCTRDYLKVFVK